MFDETCILQKQSSLKKKRLTIAPVEYFVKSNNKVSSEKSVAGDVQSIKTQTKENSLENSTNVSIEKSQSAQKNEEIQGVLKAELSGLSIKDFLKKFDEEPKEINTNSANDDFSESELEKAWEEFLKTANTSINIARKSVLESIILEKIDKQNIKVLSPSYTSQNEFEEISESFMIFLRKKINNQQIKLLYELKEETIPNTILSKEEIYKRMLSKNKNLEILRKKLGLDFN